MRNAEEIVNAFAVLEFSSSSLQNLITFCQDDSFVSSRSIFLFSSVARKLKSNFKHKYCATISVAREEVKGRKGEELKSC